MKRRIGMVIAILALAGLVSAGVLLWPARQGPPTRHTRIPRPPALSPDYANLVIPPNIAPLNCMITESGTAFHVSIRGKRGVPIELGGRRPKIQIPPAQWRALLEANIGGSIETVVWVRNTDGTWSQFEPVVNTVAAEPIDGFLVYRLLDPVFRCWGNISIRQRDLGSFDETCVLSNRTIQYDCINCHSFATGRPDRMALQIRSQGIGPRLLLARDGQAAAVNTATDAIPAASSYLAWHPNGRIIAFAAIKVTQFFHTLGETRDVFDTASDLGLYLTDSNTSTTIPAIARPDRLETYPAWSPDGRHLYFCSAPRLHIERYREVCYDLMRIGYDPESNAWGEVETLLAAGDIQGSVTHPRVSPDGRFLMFCVCDYGNFSIYHSESDLYLMDLATRRHHRMDINSDRADSYHSWSGNSRWVVFSSKRRDGLLTHPYLSYVDQAGRAHQPFILPQEDPAFYDTSLKVFNVPELVAHRADVHARALLEAIRNPSQAACATQPESWRSARAQP